MIEGVGVIDFLIKRYDKIDVGCLYGDIIEKMCYGFFVLNGCCGFIIVFKKVILFYWV